MGRHIIIIIVLHMVIFFLVSVLHVQAEQVVEEQEMVFFVLSLKEAFVSLCWVVADALEEGLEVEPAVESFVLVLDPNQ